MYINGERIRQEALCYERCVVDGYKHTYADCGTKALAAVAHTTYPDAMSHLLGFKNIWQKLMNDNVNGWKFIKLRVAKAQLPKQFAQDHPDGRYILYCGGQNHHYVPCVHGEVWNDSGYMNVTQVYQALPC